MGIQIQKICDILETQGESEWATRIDEAYYSRFGIDAVKAALARLRELQRDDDVLDRLDIRETVNGVVKILGLAAGEASSEIQQSDVARNRDLLQKLTASDDEVVGNVSAEAARRLLESLKNDQHG
ncbi:MAG TPA: hypothetical protein VMU77_04745 [Acidimicrobiales bacterium]|nr:hypothetical protein [Acidimicrobiales bacterium]